MKSHDERIRKMFEKAKELSENQVTETSNMDADIKAFFIKWENLYTMYVLLQVCVRVYVCMCAHMCVCVYIYIVHLLRYLIEFNTFRLSQRLTEISAIDRTPPKKYIEAVNSLKSFIDNVEGVLLSEHIIISDEKIMEEQIKRFKNIQNSLKEQEETFKYVNSTGQDLIAKINDDSSGQRLKDELQDLNTKWSDIPIILEEKQQTLTKGKKINIHTIL